MYHVIQCISNLCREWYILRSQYHLFSILNMYSSNHKKYACILNHFYGRIITHAERVIEIARVSFFQTFGSLLETTLHVLQMLVGDNRSLKVSLSFTSQSVSVAGLMNGRKRHTYTHKHTHTYIKISIQIITIYVSVLLLYCILYHKNGTINSYTLSRAM